MEDELKLKYNLDLNHFQASFLLVFLHLTRLEFNDSFYLLIGK